MSFLNTLNTPKLLEEDGVIKFLPSVYATQYKVNYRYYNEKGEKINDGEIIIDYDSRPNDIGGKRYFTYYGTPYKFYKNYNETFNVINNNSKYYVSGFLILNTNRTSNYKPLTVKYNDNTYEQGIQEVKNYFRSDTPINNINMSFNTENPFDNYSPSWKEVNYNRYCFNAVDLTPYLKDINYNAIRIQAINGRFPTWYSATYDSPWSNWFYHKYKENEVLLETYINKCEPETMYKYSFLEFNSIITGTFRDNVNILNPIIEIESNTVPTFNYIYIRELNRFYFVNDINIINKNLYSLECSIDVLMTYREDIDKQNVILNRSSNNYNSYLVDNLIPTELDYTTEIINDSEEDIDYTTKFNLDYSGSVGSLNIPSYSSVVLNLCNNYSTGYWTNTSPLYDSKTSLCNLAILNITSINKIYDIMTVDLSGFQEILDGLRSLIQKPSDFLISLKVYPFNITTARPFIGNKIYGKNYEQYQNFYDENERLIIGSYGYDIINYTLHNYTDTDDLSPNNINTKVFIYGGKISKIDIKPKYSFLDYEPYTIYELYIPFVGFVNVSGKKLLNYGNCYIFYTVDLTSGDTICTLIGANKKLYASDIINKSLNEIGDIIATYNTNIALNIPILRTNISDISSGLIRAGIGATKGIINMGANISNQIGDIKSLEARKTKRTTPKTKLGSQIAKEKRDLQTSTIKGSVDIAAGSLSNVVSSMTLKASTGSISDNQSTNAMISLKPFLKIYRQKIADDYDKYINYIGKPSSFFGVIGALNHYVKVGEVHLKNINCTLEELDLIEEQLLSGILIGERQKY